MLLGRDARSLQELLFIFCKLFPDTGLPISTDKSFSLAWECNKHSKKVFYDVSTKCFIKNVPLRSLTFNEKFVYLGKQRTPKGRIFHSPNLKSHLEILKSALLKPQRKFFMSRNMTFPRYLHNLVLGKVYAGPLRKFHLAIAKN